MLLLLLLLTYICSAARNFSVHAVLHYIFPNKHNIFDSVLQHVQPLFLSACIHIENPPGKKKQYAPGSVGGRSSVHLLCVCGVLAKEWVIV